MPVIFFGLAVNPVLISAQRRGPHIRQLIQEYFFWTCWCVIYTYNLMEEVKSSVKAVKQAYAQNPFKMLRRHALKFLRLSRRGYRTAKSKIRLTQSIIESVKIYLLIYETRSVTNEVLSEINFISRNLDDILAHIKLGIKAFERINRREQLFEHEYITANRRNTRNRRGNQPPQPRQVTRRRRRRVIQDENSAPRRESTTNP